MRFTSLLLFIILICLPSFANAQAFSFPPDVDTREERIEYMYNLQEKLRLRHNFVGARYRNGQITEEQWQTFKQAFKRRQFKIGRVIGFLRWREEADGSETKLYDLDRVKRAQFLKSGKYNVELTELD